jgi:hypothetical protein
VSPLLTLIFKILPGIGELIFDEPVADEAGAVAVLADDTCVELTD